MQGSLYTGTYAINGTKFITEPTMGKWLPRSPLGFDGTGHPVYSATRKFQLDWDLIDEATMNQILNFYNSTSVTGTAVVDLPQFNRADYYYVSYSGCTLSEPTLAEYFVGYPGKVTLIINKIITG